MEENKNIIVFKPAADAIKLAILRGQYEAAKGVNRIQLAVYYGVGKFISENTRKCKWGTGALEAISQILRKELPGLKGFSATQMREMRLFYEAWMMLDPNSYNYEDRKDMCVRRASYLAKENQKDSPAGVREYFASRLPKEYRPAKLGKSKD